MGWDSYSSAYNGKVLPEFEAAADEIKKQFGTVDYLLRRGGLDISDSGIALQSATGEAVWTRNRWHKRFVKRLNQEADWPAVDSMYIASAKAFLEICAKNGYSIRFSY